MSDPVLRQPTLVSVAPGGVGPPRLRARRCSCGHVTHPPQPYGCEKCGRDAAAPVEIEARGVLTAVATIYVHPRLPTPFTLGRVTLDEGPVVDVWLADAPVEAAIGTRVRAELVPATSDGGASILDVRFVPEPAR